MNSSGDRLDYLDDERLSPLAVSALPAWLWSIDASRILWANPTGAAMFGAANTAAIGTRRFDSGQPAAGQILELAAKLVDNDPPQIERLRGFGAGIGRALTCACSRIKLANDTPAILVVAAERAGPDLSFNERVTRLFAASEAPVAAFSPEGMLLHATLAADAELRGAHSLAALGVTAAAKVALQHGRAEGATANGPVALRRIGGETTAVLVADFARTAALSNDAPPALPITAVPSATVEVQAADPPPAVAVAHEQAAPAAEPPSHQRRHPLRFVWRMDEANRFTLESEEFTLLIGPRATAALGRPWHELASELGLDPEGRVAQAIATRSTWSGLHVAWPVENGAEPLTIDMSGLPVFDRDRAFRGYRGFGVCRDIARLAALPQPEPQAVAKSVPLSAGDAIAALSPLEHQAFHELSRRLAQRLQAGPEETGESVREFSHLDQVDALASAHDVRTLFDRLPTGVLIYRVEELIYANQAFLQAVGHRSLGELTEAGGLDSLLVTPAGENVEEASGQPLALTIECGDNGRLAAELIRIELDGEMAHALMLKSGIVAAAAPRADSAPKNEELAELRSILDTTTDGVVMLDHAGAVLTANRGAEALFGHEAGEFNRLSLFDLLAPESHDVAQAYFDSLRDDAVTNLLNSAREVVGRVRGRGQIPLFITLGVVGDSKDKLYAVFRDLSQWKATEQELIAAKRQAEKDSTAKSDFLAKISHEIRTPLNAIIGFSEVMMEERFGPVGNARYRDYLKDIHVSGGHLLSLINDLLDLSKIEAGKLDLTFVNVSLNDLTQQCVAIMQPQANRERVIIRSALAPKLPPVMADARSVRQIVLNLLANSIKFTGPGGQVIVSTARKDDGAVTLRVRDTGIGMSETDIETALEPFRQVATSGRPGGTGLGLPLTKALAEANRASFRIKSAPKEGTLVEVAFPASQVLVG